MRIQFNNINDNNQIKHIKNAKEILNKYYTAL